MGLWTRKTITELQESCDEGKFKLKRHLGAFDLILLGIGCIIGSGLFSITGIAAAEHAGPAIVLSFIIASIGCVFAGMCYSELAAMIPVSGSAYTYAYATMGELMAWCIGWTLILEYGIGAAVVAISWSAYVISLLQDFNIYLPPSITASPWQPVQLAGNQHAYGWINLPALLIVFIVSAVLIRGIKQSAMVNTALVLVKVSATLIFIAIGWFYVNPSNYEPFLPANTGTFGEFGWSGVFRAAGIVFLAYIGFDAVSTAAQETRNPQRNLPIGILGSLLICTIIYILFARVMTGLINYKELNVAAPVALAIAHTPFHWLQEVVKLAIITGLSSVILVLLLGQSRVFYSMAKDGLLPPLFCEIHPKFHTPWKSNLLLMFFVGLFSSFSSLELVGSMTSIGTLLAFVIVCAGVWILRYLEPDLPRPFRAPAVPFVPIMGILVCGGMMVFLGWENWVRLIVWLGIGLAIYFYYGRFHR
jgi:basic amino acid/polyamine antiporter, APA family